MRSLIALIISGFVLAIAGGISVVGCGSAISWLIALAAGVTFVVALRQNRP